jgi:hypothetical protein
MTPDNFATPEDIRDARPDLSLETIRRHMRNGTIPGAVKFRRAWLVPIAAAEDYCRNYQHYGRTDNETGPGAHPPVTPGPADPPQE